jgi:hypothetical protein
MRDEGMSERGRKNVEMDEGIDRESFKLKR